MKTSSKQSKRRDLQSDYLETNDNTLIVIIN